VSDFWLTFYSADTWGWVAVLVGIPAFALLLALVGVTHSAFHSAGSRVQDYSGDGWLKLWARATALAPVIGCVLAAAVLGIPPLLSPEASWAADVQTGMLGLDPFAWALGATCALTPVSALLAYWLTVRRARALEIHSAAGLDPADFASFRLARRMAIVWLVVFGVSAVWVGFMFRGSIGRLT